MGDDKTTVPVLPLVLLGGMALLLVAAVVTVDRLHEAVERNARSLCAQANNVAVAFRVQQEDPRTGELESDHHYAVRMAAQAITLLNAEDKDCEQYEGFHNFEMRSARAQAEIARILAHLKAEDLAPGGLERAQPNRDKPRGGEEGRSVASEGEAGGNAGTGGATGTTTTTAPQDDEDDGGGTTTQTTTTQTTQTTTQHTTTTTTRTQEEADVEAPGGVGLNCPPSVDTVCGLLSEGLRQALNPG